MMKKTVQCLAVMAAMIAILTACDLETPNSRELDGLWGGGKVASKNGNIEMIIRFTPNEADSTHGEFAMWYEGTWNDEDDAGKFAQGFSVSVPGTYAVESDAIVFKYDPDKVGVKLDDDDALEHAKVLQEAGEEGSVEAIAEDFKDMFGGYLGESFQGLFKSRNNGGNRHTFSIKDGKLILTDSGNPDIVLTKKEESSAE